MRTIEHRQDDEGAGGVIVWIAGHLVRPIVSLVVVLVIVAACFAALAFAVAMLTLAILGAFHQVDSLVQAVRNFSSG